MYCLIANVHVCGMSLRVHISDIPGWCINDVILICHADYVMMINWCIGMQVCDMSVMVHISDIPDWCYVEAWGPEVRG